MPFTFSHPAAVLPLIAGGRGRGPLVAVGLVAGAMAPDVPFFLDSVLRGSYRHGGLTHRWWAVPTVDVALAGAMAGAWYGLLREPVLRLVGPERPPERGTAGWFAVSAAIGAATHVGWDEFTHEGRAGVRLLPVLRRTVAGRPLTAVLQYGTSLAGLAVLARRTGPLPTVPPGPSAVLAAAAAAGAVHRLARRERGPIDELCFGAGAGLTLGALALAALSRAHARAERGYPC